MPMETALAGLPDVRRLRSSSQLGVSQVTVEFEPEADYYRARQLVAERVGQVATQLPPGTDAPLLSSLTGRLNEILEFTLEAEPGAVDLMTLRDLAEFEVKNRLLAVPGVAAVERLGGYLRQFQIQLDPTRMAARNVTLDEVMHAVEDANVNASGGFVVQGGTEWAVRAVGRVQTVERAAHDGRDRERAHPDHARRHRRRPGSAGHPPRRCASTRGGSGELSRREAVRRRHGDRRRRRP